MVLLQQHLVLPLEVADDAVFGGTLLLELHPLLVLLSFLLPVFVQQLLVELQLVLLEVHGVALQFVDLLLHELFVDDGGLVELGFPLLFLLLGF